MRQELVDGENYKSADEEEKEDVYDAEEYWPHHRRYHDYDDSYYDPDVLASEQAKQKYQLKAEAWSALQPAFLARYKVITTLSLTA